MALIDTHCHLYDPPLADDQPAVLQRAREAGLDGLVVVGTTLATSREALRLAEVHADLWAAVGIHPEAHDHGGELEAVAGLLDHPQVVAVGEIGLDGSLDRTTFAAQQQLFERQLAMAADRNLPVLIHSRDAAGRVLRTLQARGPNAAGGILHAWAGSVELAGQLAALGFVFGVAGVVTNPRATRVRERLAALPLEQLVLETDAPWIGTANQPKGQVEPAALPEICTALAALHGRQPAEVAALTGATAQRVLRLEAATHAGSKAG
jgi:TatD DNase family protein